ncbi:unnamed protein product [Choristocarpus tenellus]
MINIASSRLGAHVVRFSSEMPGCLAANVLDENPNHLWLSDPTQGLPQHIVITLRPSSVALGLEGVSCEEVKEDLEIRTMGWYCWHAYSTNPAHVNLYLSSDGISWTLWDSVFGESKAGIQVHEIRAFRTLQTPFIKFEVARCFGAQQAYFNRLYLHSESVEKTGTALTPWSNASVVSENPLPTLPLLTSNVLLRKTPVKVLSYTTNKGSLHSHDSNMHVTSVMDRNVVSTQGSSRHTLATSVARAKQSQSKATALLAKPKAWNPPLTTGSSVVTNREGGSAGDHFQPPNRQYNNFGTATISPNSGPGKGAERSWIRTESSLERLGKLLNRSTIVTSPKTDLVSTMNPATRPTSQAHSGVLKGLSMNVGNPASATEDLLRQHNSPTDAKSAPWESFCMERSEIAERVVEPLAKSGVEGCMTQHEAYAPCRMSSSSVESPTRSWRDILSLGDQTSSKISPPVGDTAISPVSVALPIENPYPGVSRSGKEEFKQKVEATRSKEELISWSDRIGVLKEAPGQDRKAFGGSNEQQELQKLVGLLHSKIRERHILAARLDLQERLFSSHDSAEPSILP